MVSTNPLFILIHGRFGAGIFGIHHGPTMHGGKQPPVEDGLRWQWWGCGRTPGAAALGLAPLATDFMLWAVGWA